MVVTVRVAAYCDIMPFSLLKVHTAVALYAKDALPNATRNSIQFFFVGINMEWKG